MMRENGLRHIPMLDEDGRLEDLVLLNDLIEERPAPLNAVVMAGGFGKRLLPLTNAMPKPMLPIGDRPIIEHIVAQLRDSGIRQLNITTHYMPETIERHLGNGEKFGVVINYLHEDTPRGTAGALGLLEPWNSTLLVVNGDILTSINYASMLAFHQENRAVATVGVREFKVEVPYGVVKTEGVKIRELEEKPTIQFFVNAGIYLLEPEAYGFVDQTDKFDMTDLITRMLKSQRRIISFPISEYWVDIGQPNDYERAQLEFPSGNGIRG